MKACFVCIALLVSVVFSAQTINLHSITTLRQISGDKGYTLDGQLMINSARPKLLNPLNFGPSGRYSKSIIIHDSFGSSGSLTEATKLPTKDLFFFGTFNTLEQSTEQFTTAEVDSLYQWSLRGGKLIIASGCNNAVFSTPNNLNSKWGFSWAGGGAGMSVQATNESSFTDLFNGPFGRVNAAKQGGGLQGYFYKLLNNVKILGTDGNDRPSLIMDCNTLDLIIADVDVYTQIGGVSNNDIIAGEQNIFLANTIAFMDKLQAPPFLNKSDKSLSVNSNYLDYQWFHNATAITNATTSALNHDQSGSYYVEVTVNGGCKIKSDIYYTPDVDPANNCEIFVPSAFSPNGNGTNEMACVYGTCLKEMEFRIFNRWGEMIFQSMEQNTCWDGTYKGSKADNGAYGWSVNAKTYSNKAIEKKGHITLIR